MLSSIVSDELWLGNHVVGLLIACVIVSVLYHLRQGAAARPRPPGPSLWSLIKQGGPPKPEKQHIWEWFEQLGQEHQSDVVYIPTGQAPLVILNSPEAAHDLLEKNSAFTSSRPNNKMLDMFAEGVLLSTRYGPAFRQHRRLIQLCMTNAAVAQHRPYEAREITRVMRKILDDPQSWEKALKVCFSNILMNLTYGMRSDAPENAEQVKQSGNLASYFLEYVSPEKYAVNVFPILAHIPSFLAPWKAKVLRQRSDLDRLIDELLDVVKGQMAQGTAQPSYVRDLLEMDQTQFDNLSPREFALVAWTPFGAGIETLCSAGSHFSLAMIACPETFLDQARAEIDRVCGAERMPSIEDWPDLPYCQLVVKELFRWQARAVFGVPHASSEDIEYRGWIIPKGAVFITNNWTIHRDTRYFPDPDEFRPERWQEEQASKMPLALGHGTFGLGRRACPGQHIAGDILHLLFMRIIWGFEVVLAANSPAIDLSPSGFVNHNNQREPKPFKVDIRPRSEKHRKIILQEFEAL